MSDDAMNPYAAPLTGPEGGPGLGMGLSIDVPELRMRSVILMIVLSVVTLGLYINYWVHTNADIINRRLGYDKISKSLVIVFWIISLSALVIIVPYLLMEDITQIEGISDILDLVNTVFTIFIAFAVRGGLDELIQSTDYQRNRFKGLWTFLFGIFYLQWKINRHRESGVITD